LGTDAKVVRHVRVCGDGDLAIATRIELHRLGIQRDTDYLLPSLRPDLVIACADSEKDLSFIDVAQQAASEGCPLLFACLAGRILRLGPLIDPATCFITVDSIHTCPSPPGTDPEHQSPCAEPTLESPGTGPPYQPPHAAYSPAHESPPPATARTAEADPPLNLYARLGALLISAQALNFLLGARNQCVRDRAVEFNPWSMESKAYRVFKVRQ
jgi:hypothetical protein